MHIVEKLQIINPFSGRIGLTIGNFEGFHRGHQLIVKELVSESRKRRLFPTVITFKQHPVRVLSGKEPGRLMAPSEKLKYFIDLGIDLLFYIDFNLEFARTYPLEFLDMLKAFLAPELLCLGRNFRFGRKNEGNVNFLLSQASKYGFDLNLIDDISQDGKPVSSTRIRHEIREGNMGKTSNLLGRRYAVHLVTKPDDPHSLIPFIPEITVPFQGSFSGELENLDSGKLEREIISIKERELKPFLNKAYAGGVLHRFFFGGPGEGS